MATNHNITITADTSNAQKGITSTDTKLAGLTAKTLQQGLALLGIDTLERM